MAGVSVEIGASSEGAAALDQESPEMAVMKATMVELEEEIVRLRQQLEEATVLQSQTVAETTDAAEYREQLAEDIRRLEAARDQLLQTIERLADSPELAVEAEPDSVVLPISQAESEGRVGYTHPASRRKPLPIRSRQGKRLRRH